MRCARPGPFFVGIFHIWKLRSCSFTPLFLLHCLPGFLRPGPGNESPVLVPRFKLFDDADFRLGGEEGGSRTRYVAPAQRQGEDALRYLAEPAVLRDRDAEPLDRQSRGVLMP